jgi:hypothetical protein
MRGDPANGRIVSDQLKNEAEVAVPELRLFISAYEGVELPPDSRAARQLEAAPHAVAATTTSSERCRRTQASG